MTTEAYPRLETVFEAVRTTLSRSDISSVGTSTSAQGTEPHPDNWRLEAAHIRHMPWSTLYFLTATDDQTRQELVVKIVRFPDQTTAETSWQSDELLRRGQREFDSMQRVFEHFQTQSNASLCALRPQAYLPELNAVVMDYVGGTTLYDGYATLSRLLTPKGQGRAIHLMQQAGQWLYHLHTLPRHNVPGERIFTPQDTFQALLDEVAGLRQWGIHLDTWPGWDQTSTILSQLESDVRVWTHGDLHMRNVFVLPGDRILAFDTALERVDSPYFDLGKFTADLKTRRGRVLRYGLLPSARLVDRLSRAFLAGYTTGQPYDTLLLRLYEGRFMLQKWNESLSTLENTFSGVFALPGAVMRRLVINPTFSRLSRHWMRNIVND